MIITFIILAATILLFVFSKLRPDLVAVLSLLALYLSGVITTQQALAGFADSTVILIAALFVVGEGLSRTGITAWLGEQLLQRAGDSETRLLIVLVVGTALISSMLSNTGTVAMLLPAAVAAAWRIGSIPSRFLMPMAFGASLGGLLTLIGSPTNIVVSDTLSAAGLAPFGFFEFAKIGLPLLLAGVVLMRFAAPRLLTDRPSGDRPVDLQATMAQMADSYGLLSRLFVLSITAESDLAGKTLRDLALGERYSLTVLRIERQRAETSRPLTRRLVPSHFDRDDDDDELTVPGGDTVVQVDDKLLVKGTREDVARAADALHVPAISVKSDESGLADIMLSHEVGLAEILVAPRSDYAGHTLAESDIAAKFNVQVISLLRGDRLMPRQRTRLELGDTLLVRGRWADIERLRDEQANFVVVGDPQAVARQVVDFGPASFIALVALVGMIILMVTGIVPTVIAALIAAVVMILGRAVTAEGAYRAINWSTVVLIAAMLPMSTAMEVTGGAEFLANSLVQTLGSIGPLAILAGVFILTALLSQVMSNTATVVLLAPIVMQTAQQLQTSPYPLMMATAVAAAAAFLTPIASPTNMLVFTPGGYQFSDFSRLGLPLLLLVFVVSIVLIPVIWPFS